MSDDVDDETFDEIREEEEIARLITELRAINDQRYDIKHEMMTMFETAPDELPDDIFVVVELLASMAGPFYSAIDMLEGRLALIVNAR